LTADTLTGRFKTKDALKIVPRVPAATASKVVADQKLIATRNDNAVTGADSRVSLGWVILNDNSIPPTGSL
jgi:hypothetical protein